MFEKFVSVRISDIIDFRNMINFLLKIYLIRVISALFKFPMLMRTIINEVIAQCDLQVQTSSAIFNFN